MNIIIDTREQQELDFNGLRYVDNIIKRKLDCGDYAAEFKDGYIPPIVFERKSINDLYGTLSKGYSRFKKEIIRAQNSNIVMCIIVEGNYSKILKGIEHSDRNGQSICDQLFTLLVKHHVPFICCKSREEMAKYIVDCYVAVGKQYMFNKKK